MRRNGPLLTLLGGLVLASVLIAFSVHASRARQVAAPTSAAAPRVNALISPKAAPPPRPTAQLPTAPPSAAAYRATYAGYTTGGAATVAIVVRDGVAIAYVCDGTRVEAWLRGTAVAGQLRLTGTHSSSLTGGYTRSGATGQVSVGAKHWTFRARAVSPPSGLYRATAEVRNAKVVGGWIVLDGRQVGVETVDGTPQPASTLDTASRTAIVDGATLTAVPVDGTETLR
jgi:serine/threonine-protein kinase